MKIFIFDLDNTLLYKPYKNYDDIKKDTIIYNLLSSFSYQLYIYSNATIGHVDKSLIQLGLQDLFINKFARDTIPKMKPYIESYKYVNTAVLFNSVNLDYNYTDDINIYFFDDLLVNLKTAKLCGWVTIWINPSKYMKPLFVDFHFNNIIDALIFFKKLENL
tara:strand:- start:375 stop:860 length:486 start_codon:yes stop_codon:yes gene_type:complete